MVASLSYILLLVCNSEISIQILLTKDNLGEVANWPILQGREMSEHIVGVSFSTTLEII